MTPPSSTLVACGGKGWEEGGPQGCEGWEQPHVMTLLSLMAAVVMIIKPKPLRSWLKRPFLWGLTTVPLLVLLVNRCFLFPQREAQQGMALREWCRNAKSGRESVLGGRGEILGLPVIAPG